MDLSRLHHALKPPAGYQLTYNRCSIMECVHLINYIVVGGQFCVIISFFLLLRLLSSFFFLTQSIFPVVVSFLFIFARALTN